MKRQRMVYVPGVEKWIPLGAYLKFVKAAKDNPEEEFQHTLQGWWPGTGSEIMREFQRGMVDRINQAVPYTQRGIR